jgi:hypothetical protein
MDVKPYKGDCKHPLRERSKGGYKGLTHARFPLVYGSAEVELCCACGAWHMNVHRPNEWRAGPYAAVRAAAVLEGADR